MRINERIKQKIDDFVQRARDAVYNFVGDGSGEPASAAKAPSANKTTSGPGAASYTAPAASYRAPASGGNAARAPYMEQLNSLYNQIVNRGPFQYDLNGDMLYRQMADQYTQMGRQAMRDATGTAAGLTGGYGNSYANMVGNQAYQQYLTQLNNNIPELYDRAYAAWQDEGNQLLADYEATLAHANNTAPVRSPGYAAAVADAVAGAETAAGIGEEPGFWNALVDRANNVIAANAWASPYYMDLYEDMKKKK